MWHALKRGEMHTAFSLDNLIERDQWEDLDVDILVILREMCFCKGR
jgi:hypothetical protein